MQDRTTRARIRIRSRLTLAARAGSRERMGYRYQASAHVWRNVSLDTAHQARTHSVSEPHANGSSKGALMDSYKLIPEPIPPISKAAVYEDAMDDFLKRKDASCRVLMEKKKPSTIHQGLLKAKRLNPRFAGIAIVRRGDAIYLKK
jgi:hypothetical protein